MNQLAKKGNKEKRKILTKLVKTDKLHKKTNLVC